MGEAKSSHVNVDNIDNYIEQMKIKKAINGFDRVDVFNKMNDFQEMFHCHMETYEKIMEENEATISSLTYQVETKDMEQQKCMEREKQLIIQIEEIKQKLSQTQVIAADLEHKLDDEKKVRLKLEEELAKGRKLIQEYQNREKEDKTEKEARCRIKNSMHLSIVQEKIEAELALLKFREDYNKEKEKLQMRQGHMQAAGNEMLECLKQIEKSIEYMDGVMRSGL